MATAKNITWITTSNPNGSFADWLKRNHPDAILEEEPGVWTKANPFTVTKEKIEKDEYIPIQRNDFMDVLNKVMVRKCEELKENEMVKVCGNCKYEKIEYGCLPCRGCCCNDRWEPKEEKMDNRLNAVKKELEYFAKEKRLSYNFYHSYENNYLSITFWEGGVTKAYRVYGDGCDPAKEISRIVASLTNAFKLKSSTVHGDLPAIKDIIFNDPATIVFWVDGTKTVVKAQDEAYDPEKGMAMAIAKKALGNQGNYCNVFKKWLPEEEAYSDFRNKDEAKSRRDSLISKGLDIAREMRGYNLVRYSKSEILEFMNKKVDKYISTNILDFRFGPYIESALQDEYGVDMSGEMVG